MPFAASTKSPLTDRPEVERAAELQLPAGTIFAMGRAGLVRRTALCLLGIGSLLLAFVAYQLWGTALYEHSAQHRLVEELKGKLTTHGTLPSSPQPVSSQQDPTTSVASRVAPPEADPATGSALGLLSIPAIGITNTAIVEGTGEDQLEEGPGHYQGTPLPGEAGNSAIAGHRTTYGAPFYSLGQLQAGDAINISTPQGLFGYVVVNTKIVLPGDTSVLDPSVLPTLTLTTCNPRYSSTQRLVVQALLHTAVLTASVASTPTSTTPSRTSKLPRTLAGADTSSAALAGSDVAGGVLGAVLWGLGAALAAVAAWLAWRRLRGAPRLLTLAGTVAGLACLLQCFGQVSRALPASF